VNSAVDVDAAVPIKSRHDHNPVTTAARRPILKTAATATADTIGASYRSRVERVTRDTGSTRSAATRST
jgi:hypothetical protein